VGGFVVKIGVLRNRLDGGDCDWYYCVGEGTCGRCLSVGGFFGCLHLHANRFNGDWGQGEGYSGSFPSSPIKTFLHAFHLLEVRFSLSLLGPSGPTIDYPIIPKLHRRSLEAILACLVRWTETDITIDDENQPPSACIHANVHMHVCTDDLVSFSTPPHTPTSTRLVVAVNLCQPACMSMKEGTSESFGSYRCTHLLYVCQYLCVVMQVGQIGSCRRAYGRKIAVLLQGDLLSYCGLFASDVLTALIALRRVGVQLELCIR
jgi:hypothetical protein